MKLITELNEQCEFIVEADETGKKSHFIEGIFMQAEQKNRNNRMYPASVMRNEVARYNKEYVSQNRAFGELGHPDGPTINLDRVSHMIKSIKEDSNNNFIGRAKIMDTPLGNIVKSLIDEGANLGVSSRGMGSLKPSMKGECQIVQDDYRLATAADIVADPSAPNAFVRGIMEGQEWVFSEEFGWRAIDYAEQTRTAMKKSSVKEINEQKIAAFETFLDKISRS